MGDLCDQFQAGILVDGVQHALAHGLGVGIAGLPHDERHFTLDLAAFLLEPFHHGLSLQLTDRPAILHHHEIQRAVDHHRVVADYLGALAVGQPHQRAGQPGIDRLQHDHPRAVIQHLFELPQLGQFAVAAGIEQDLRAQRFGAGDEFGLVGPVALLLHGFEQEADLEPRLLGVRGGLEYQRCRQQQEQAGAAD